ncbi:MAG: hypothetical protein ABJE95_17690 [Byssovorax sp.]
MSLFTVWFLVPCALVLALAWLWRGVFLGYPAKDIPTRNLSRKEQAILAAAADALFPPGGPIPLSGTDAGAIPYLDAYVGRVDRTQRALMRLLFTAIEHGPWLLGPHFARFTRLDPASRIVFLRKLAKSDLYFLRVIFLSIRVMLTMAYLANDDVARRMRMETNLAPFAPRARAKGAPEPSVAPSIDGGQRACA